jgi:tRNA(Phe) wybutosine-synthesizing methylase Tyw3
MGLAERVSAGDQRNRLLVIHRHARKGLANVPRRGHRIRLAVRPFRIHVDQAHLHRAQRILQLRSPL